MEIKTLKLSNSQTNTTGEEVLQRYIILYLPSITPCLYLPSINALFINALFIVGKYLFIIYLFLLHNIVNIINIH